MPQSTDAGSRPYSLKGQLAILFAALAIPLLLLQGWWSYHDYQDAREQAWADALAFADAVDLGIRQFMEQSETLLRTSAREYGPTWLELGTCGDDMVELERLLPFETVLVLESDGRIVCSTAPVPPRASAVDWPWFDALGAADSMIVGPPTRADFVDSWILPLVAPIADEDGSVAGAAVGALPLGELSRRLGGYRSPEEQLTTVATADRVIIARSVEGDQWVGRHLPPPTGSDRLIAPGRWVAEGPDLSGVQRTWGQVETESGWIVYVGIPDDVIFGPARREALAHMGGTLLVVLLGLLLATVSYARIGRALRELAAGTRVSEAGEVVAVPPDTPEEIGAVVEQFNETLRARNRAEEAERAARERYKSIFENAVFGIYVSSADGRFLQVNPALAEMLGYDSPEELMAAGPGAVYADPRERQELVAASLASGEVEIATHELEWIRADGSPIMVRVAGKLLEDEDGTPVFEMIVQDITEEKRTEDQLRQTQKMEAIGQLAGGVAHDFNNLLTVIGGNVELLEDEVAPENPLRHDLEQIARATRRASSLTQRLLAFSRRSRRSEQTVDVEAVVPEMTRMLVPVIGEQVRLSARLEDGPHRVSIDPGELEQLLLNLVLNARDAIPGDGSIRIETRAETRRTADSTAPGVRLSVVDDGVGMDAATRAKIFEPFYTTKDMGEGTGLGLSTVYGITQRAGGEITVESEPGRGTRIDVWLPTVDAPPSVDGASPEAMSGTGSETVLVVEDDDLVRGFVARALKDGGFDVLTASSGDEAMELLGGEAAHVDLVLTDVVMPGLSGPHLAEEIMRVLPGTPVLFMSGYIDNPFLQDELEDRPELLVRKPFTAKELQARVRAALDGRAQVEGTPTR